jgi:FixJ family two-component response regulator
MALAVSGLLNKLFGGELGISKITVKQTKAWRSKK